MNGTATSALRHSAQLKRSMLRLSWAATFLSAGFLATASTASLADESGTSFWLPGQYGSLAQRRALRDGHLRRCITIRQSARAPTLPHRAKSRSAGSILL